MKFMVDHHMVWFFFFVLLLIKKGFNSGAGTLAGTQGERKMSQLELQVAQTQGLEFGKLVLRLTGSSTQT